MNVNAFLSRVALVCGGLILLLAHKFVAPVMAGLVLAAGLSPVTEKHLIRFFPWTRLRKVLFPVAFLSTYGALGTYILVTSARTIAKNVHFKSNEDTETHHVLEGQPPPTEGTVLPELEVKEEVPVGVRIEEVPEDASATSYAKGMIEKAKKLLERIPGMNADEVTRTWGEIIRGARNIALSLLSKILSAGPAIFLQSFVFLFSFFIFFWNYEKFSDFLHSLESRNRGIKECIKFFEDAARATLVGTLIVGLAQGTIISIGTAVAGFESYVLLGLCAFFASYIPFFGTGLVWVSALLYALINGDTQAAVVVGIAGACSSIADNIILPTFMGSQTRVNPLLVFVVVFSLIEIVGIWGLLLGPVLAIFSTRVFELLTKA